MSFSQNISTNREKKVFDKVLFDLDGTLLDTSEGVLESVHFVMGQMGLKSLCTMELSGFNGFPIQDSFMKYCHCNHKQALEAANLFREYYRKEALFKAKPYDGIVELCRKLHESGYKLAVATYKREDYALRLLAHFGFDRYCVSMHGADKSNIMKKSDIIKLCLNDLGGRKEECVLIGDTENDAASAYDVGISFLPVTYGYGFRSKKDAAEFACIGIAVCPLDILDCLQLSGEGNGKIDVA